MDNIVLVALQNHLQVGSALEKKVDAKNDSLLKTAETQKIQKQIRVKELELQRSYRLLASLSGSLLDEIITENEYHDLKNLYTNQAPKVEKEIAALQLSVVQIIGRKNETHTWISELSKHENLAIIERSVVVTFIDHVLIYADKRVKIIFRWQDECDWLETALANENLSQCNEVLI